MTSAHSIPQNTTRIVSHGWGRKVGAIAVGAAAIGTLVVANPFTDTRSGDSTATARASASPVEQSVLLDAQRFDLAAADAVSEAVRPSIVDRPADFATQAAATATAATRRSALLDGAAFDAAIADVVGSVEVGRSALLDGAAFDAAIADVVGSSLETV